MFYTSPQLFWNGGCIIVHILLRSMIFIYLDCIHKTIFDDVCRTYFSIMGFLTAKGLRNPAFDGMVILIIKLTLKLKSVHTLL